MSQYHVELTHAFHTTGFEVLETEIGGRSKVVWIGYGFVNADYRDESVAIALRSLRGEKPKMLGIDTAGFKVGLKVWKALDKAA